MTVDRRTFVALSTGLLAAGPVAAQRAAGEAGGSGKLENLWHVMPASVEKTWHAFTNLDARKIWWGFPNDPLQGALEVRPQRLIRSRIDHPGLPGPVESTVLFETAGNGCRVTHGYSGLGTTAEWQNASQTMAHGVHEMMADLALYLRTGAGFPRHVKFRSFDFLKGTREVPGGLEVFEPAKGTLAEQLGLRAGDTIVGFAGAGVFTFCDVHFAGRAFPPGSEVEVHWVRGNQLMSGKGRMTGTMPVRATAAN
jgi:uncharacterized protein YndB with AHSA1/START domain